MARARSKPAKQKPSKSNSLGLDFFKGRILNDCLLVQPLIMTSDNGVAKPLGYEDKTEWGQVLMTGEGRLFDNGTRLPPAVNVGSKIFFQKYGPQKVRLSGKDYFIIREEDVYWVGE